jgi:hypothetical protein
MEIEPRRISVSQDAVKQKFHRTAMPVVLGSSQPRWLLREPVCWRT